MFYSIRSWLMNKLKMNQSSSQQLSNVQYFANVEEGEAIEVEEVGALTRQPSKTSSRYSRYSDHTYERISLLVPPPDLDSSSPEIYDKIIPKSDWKNPSLHHHGMEEEEDPTV